MSNPPADPHEEALDRYLSGECTPAERARVEASLAAYPMGGRAVSALLDALHHSGETPPHVSVVWAAMRARIAHDLAPASEVSQSVPSAVSHGGPLRGAAQSGLPTFRPALDTSARRWWRQTSYIAMILTVAAVGWMAGVRYMNRQAASSALVYSTGNGERANIALPDGSLVSLDVASRLEVPADYVHGDHTVQLQGEALFTVTHHDGMPFTVIAGGAATRVLGTSFVVRHYPADSITTVAVREGKVAVRTTVLTSGEALEMDRHAVLRVGTARPSQFTFATGVMTLDSLPLAEAIARLDRWYDADIRLQDPALATQQIKGEFAAGSISNLTEILRATFDVNVLRNGRVLTLVPRQRGSAK